MLKSNPNISRNRVGFTLIELLVVIAVIGILAAVLVPVISSSRERAVMLKDLGKLKAIGGAMALYAIENNNRLPNASVPIAGTANPSDPNSSNRWVFYEAVDRYLDPVAGFNPYSIYNYQRRDVWYAEAAGQSPDASPRRIGFAPNPYLFKDFVSASGSWDGFTVRVPSPSQVVIVAEVNIAPQDGTRDLDPSSQPTSSASEESSYRVSRNGSGYYLFADYHVDLLEGDLNESVKPEMWFW